MKGMIGRLKGVLVSADDGIALVECGGVGYEVILPDRILMGLPPGEEVTLHIRHVVREDAQVLYGFSETFERRMFDRLLGVSGCGPKAAMGLLSAMEAEDLAFAIASGDARLLTRAPGIGLRTAERIVVDLKEKMAAAALERQAGGRTAKPKTTAPNDELLDALMALGYKKSEAEDAADKVRDEVTGVPAQIRAALVHLRKS